MSALTISINGGKTQVIQLGTLNPAVNQQITQAVASASASATSAATSATEAQAAAGEAAASAASAAESAAEAAASAGSNFAPWYIPAGSTFVVPTNLQVLAAMTIVADGDLQTDGYLIEV